MSHFHATIGKGGRVVIPASARAALNLRPGDDLTLMLHNGELRMVKTADAVRRAQSIVARYLPAGHDLVQTLIEQRRTEATHE
ncbi:MAG: AbrB/MazE/SpoVT family DNA-binding domain-containing protein [Thermaerobacter sp.]|nr:AbrB/MazE/SpoVT family DNA-binding domain-containing protein [Thermaerobacter sp.]